MYQKTSDLKEKIVEILEALDGKPITQPELCTVLCISGSRLRQIVAELVIGGKPIVTGGSGGYHIAKRYDDVRHEINSLRSRAVKIIKRAAALEKISAPKFAGQIALVLSKEEAA